MFLRAGFALLVTAPLLAATPQPSRAQWNTDGTPLCVAPNPQRYPRLVSDGAGGAIVAWFDYRGGNWDIYAQHVLASGVVDPACPANGVVLCNAPNSQTYSQIVSDGAGGAIVSWQDMRNGSSDIYAQHMLASGAVDPTWATNGVAICNAADNQNYPQMVADGAGGAIIAWVDWRDPASNVYAHHLLASGVVDPAWTADGNLACAAANNQEDLAIVSDGTGGAIVVWSDFRSGTQADIYAQRVLASGAGDPAWPTDGRRLCGASGDQTTPACVSDGAGGAVVAWQDRRMGAGSDLYAHHVSASGIVDPLWTPDGTLLCNAAEDQNYPEIVSDGAGGAMVTWEDYRSGTGFDVYAQRVLASGTVDPSWASNGNSLCDAPNDQTYPRIVADGAGGAIVIWCDGRGGGSDLYAQHVLASGSADPDWVAGGALVCNAVDRQIYPELIPDGAGGALVTWFDYRSGVDSDIYAQRLHGNGSVTHVASEGWESFTVRAPYPNPAGAAGTTLGLDLSTPRRVSASVYDVAGQLVRTLAVERELPAGSHSVAWDGTSEGARRAGPGLYFILVRAGGVSFTRRVVLLHRRSTVR